MYLNISFMERLSNMKIYIFNYFPKNIENIPDFLPSKITSDLSRGIGAPYAIALTKKDRDLFCKYRNMRVFEMETYVCEDKDECDKICAEYDYAVLSIYKFKTADTKNGKRCFKYVTLQATDGEYEYIECVGMNDIVLELAEHISDEFPLLNKKVRHAIYKTFKCDIFLGIDTVSEAYAFEYLDYIDQVNAFVKLYGYTLKE